MPTRANAILTHIRRANFVLIVLDSIQCSKSHCIPLWEIPIEISLLLSHAYPTGSWLSLELQYGSGVSVGMDPADEVEVPHVEGAVRAAGQRHGSKQHHVPGGAGAAWTAGDAPVETIPHHGADDGRLLGEEHVLPVALVKDSWGGRNEYRKHIFSISFLLWVMGSYMNTTISSRVSTVLAMTDFLYFFVLSELLSLVTYLFAPIRIQQYFNLNVLWLFCWSNHTHTTPMKLISWAFEYWTLNK